jgi:hypothetical protein
MGNLYLRDLKDTLREDIEKQIRKHRPDLIKALEEGEDISIGDMYNPENFGLIN